MFAIPYLFGILGRDTQRTKLLQLLKQFERGASLGFTREGSPLHLEHIQPRIQHKKEFQRELLFSQDGVSVFKIQPKPTVADDDLQKFNWIMSSKDHTYDETKLYFILKAHFDDQTHEKDVRKLIKPTTILNNLPISVLAWARSQLTFTLLASSTVEEYAMFGSAFLNKNLDTSVQFHVEQMYSVEYSTSSRTEKPPNVLIYTGETKQSSENFKKTKEILGQCLDRDKYVIYQLKHNHVLTYPWKENASLLVVATDQGIEKSLKNTIDDYVESGGRLISLCSLYTLGATGVMKPSGVKISQDVNMCKNIESSVKSLGVPCVDTVFEVEQSDGVNILALSSSTSQAVIISVLHGAGMALLCSVNVFTDESELCSEVDNRKKRLLKDLLNYLGLTCNDLKKSVLTKAYLLGNEQNKKTFLESIDKILVDGCFKGNNINLEFCHNGSNKEGSCPTESCLPIITSSEQVSFSFPLYSKYLEAKYLGQLVIYSDVITSTQTILNGSAKLVQKLPRGCGPVVVGRQQTLGKGRGGNDWLSPDGCLSFSFSLQVHLDSHLGGRLPFLQHMAALAVVEAVRGIQNYEGVDLRIKWPNDIYFGRETKIGGILVNSSIQGKILYAVIGIGVNLDNSEPTTCINDILERENHLREKNLRKLSREQLLARIINVMERLLDDFQENGPENFLAKYHQMWLHSATQVTLENQNGEQVTVTGLDDMGFLSVINSSNEVISVQPDGNSFDMMRNLIAMKTR